MQRRQCYRWLTVTLCFFIASCSAAPPPPPRVTVSPPPPPAPQVGWLGDKAQIAVVEFDDRTRGRAPRRGNLLGRGMEAQLVTALWQTGQFSVLEPQEKTVRGKKGEFITAQVGSHEEPEFFVSGSVIAYRLSPASVAAGVAADPLLGTADPSHGGVATAAAERAFSNLSTSETDQVEIALSLFDGKTGWLISETRIPTAPQDFSPTLEGIFSADLLRSAVASEPLTQRAVRAGVIKAVNWIADRCLEYRRQQALNPDADEPRLPLAKKSQKAVAKSPTGD